MASIAECLARSEELHAVSDSARLDVELLLSYCLEKNTTFLRTWPEREVPAEAGQVFEKLLSRRLQGEPIAYLIGSRGFWTLDLDVNSSTLIPRPETELLVEQCLERLPAQKASILDLGTGTGAIALALASENKRWQVLGCDVQVDAVLLAEKNRQQLAINNAQFIQSDWFDAIPLQCFDLIVSNPPYIDPEDPHLNEGDVRFEPRSALVAENKGLADIEVIIISAMSFLQSSGWLLFEHGYNQSQAVQELLINAGFNHIETIKDLAGMDRVTLGQRP